MRLRARIDDTQPAVVAALRKIGCSVLSLAPLGHGCPDLLVGSQSKHGVSNWLLEVKNGLLVPSKRKLTPDEASFFAGWRGQLCLVESAEEAVAHVLRLRAGE